MKAHKRLKRLEFSALVHSPQAVTTYWISPSHPYSPHSPPLKSNFGLLLPLSHSHLTVSLVASARPMLALPSLTNELNWGPPSENSILLPKGSLRQAQLAVHIHYYIFVIHCLYLAFIVNYAYLIVPCR